MKTSDSKAQEHSDVFDCLFGKVRKHPDFTERQPERHIHSFTDRRNLEPATSFPPVEQTNYRPAEVGEQLAKIQFVALWRMQNPLAPAQERRGVLDC